MVIIMMNKKIIIIIVTKFHNKNYKKCMIFVKSFCV